MGSRLRENPLKLFEVFVEVGKPDDGKEPFILQTYPADYDDKECLKQIPKFIYPCEIECSNVDHFTFVFTNMESNYMFGFCRHATGAQTCLCIISFLPWFEVFYKQLNLMAEILNRTENNDLTPLLESTSSQEVPMPGVPVTIVAKQEMFSFTSPDLSQLPSIPASRNLTEYYNAIDTNNMMVIFASMLNERRVIFTSKKLSRLTACIHGAESLLYPMHWQHLFIPVLPLHLIDYVAAPMPFVIGIHASMMQDVRKHEIGDVIVVDTDRNTVETSHDDMENLPEEVSSYLRKHLKSDKVKSSMLVSGDAISRAFLNALVRLIGGYRDALRFRAGEPITFDRDAFVSSRPPIMQAFLENMLQLQIFEQFINERLDILNCGNGFNDLFEKEAVLHADKLNTQSKYKEWASNMKRQGKKFQRSSKEVLSDVKEKAPIMMNSAVQSMKHQGKKAFTGIKAKLNEINDKTPKGSRGHHTKGMHRERPTTIIGSEVKGSRPPRPPLPLAQSMRLKATERHSTQYRLIDVIDDEKQPKDEDFQFEYQRVSINLLSDPDIKYAFERSPSSELLNDDSSATDTSSSGAQTPGEMQDSEIPYVDFDSNKSEHNTQAEFRPLSRNLPGTQKANPIPQPRRSLIMDKNGSNGSVAIPPPIPAQRTMSKVASAYPPRPPKPLTKEEQLIRFESTESEPDSEFDPLAAKHTPIAADSGQFQRTPERRSLINRSPAFRQHGLDTPKRNSYRPDSSPDNSGTDDASVIFDPLAGFDKSIYSSPSSLRETFPVSPLLQNWSIGQLVTTAPKGSPMTNLPYSMPRTQAAPTASAPAPKPRLSMKGNAYDPIKSNPTYNTSQSNNQTTVGGKSNASDPFADLAGLQIGPTVLKSDDSFKSVSSWETFD